jgi:cell division protein FtsW
LQWVKSSKEDGPGKREKWSSCVFAEPVLMSALLVLLVIGIGMIYSTSSYRAEELYEDSLYFTKRQVIYISISLVAMFFMTRFDYRRLMPLLRAILVSSLILQVVVLVVGTASHGSARWLYIGPVGFQPSEYAKTAIIIYTAAICAVEGAEVAKILKLLRIMLLPVTVIVLIGVENLSTAIICFGILVVILFVSSPKTRHFVIIGVCGIIGVVLFILFAGYRATRVKVWLSPESYDEGYQTIQSLYAVGSGGLFGTGFGKSIQKMGFIPESHNDMIFSVVCEELGLFGAGLIIGIFLILLYRLCIVAMNARDRFGCLLTVGIMAHLAVQMLINVSVVTNTIPPTGVPMPLISYGGSSIMFILAEMGIAMSVARRNVNRCTDI